MTFELMGKLRELFYRTNSQISSVARLHLSTINMVSSFVRSAFGGTVLRAGKQAAFTPTIFIRGKATLPDLACEFRNYRNKTIDPRSA
jgi:hypothetical protein